MSPAGLCPATTGERVKGTWPNKKIYKTRCHYVFTNSKDTTANLKQAFALSDMHIFSIPDGIALPDAAPNNATQTAARQELANRLGLETDARFIGIFGKIERQSIPLLCKTADQLGRRFSYHHLVIAGSSETQTPVDKKIYPHVHMLPQTEENNGRLYPALDCCIYLPDTQNFYQGVPLEVTGAMAGFCPVIGPDTPGIRDILIDHQTGRVFDPRKPDSLPKIINWTLDTPQAVQTLTQTARALVEQHYTMDAMGRDILRIYRLRLIKNNRIFPITS